MAMETLLPVQVIHYFLREYVDVGAGPFLPVSVECRNISLRTQWLYVFSCVFLFLTKRHWQPMGATGEKTNKMVYVIASVICHELVLPVRQIGMNEPNLCICVYVTYKYGHKGAVYKFNLTPCN